MSWSQAADPHCKEAAELRPVELVIHAKPRSIGDFAVRRALPTAAKRSVGPFVFFDEMGPADLKPGRAMDVRPHPHINLATITYLYEGAISHRDSLGTHQVIEPGAVNLMVAGRAIVHSERTPDALRPVDKRLHGLQLWLALPAAEEETDPAFEHHPAVSIPEWQNEGVRAKILMGEAHEHRSPVRTHSPTLYVTYELDAGAGLEVPMAEERGVYVVAGRVEVEGAAATFEAGSMVVLSAKDVRLRATDQTRCALIGGQPLGHRHMFWNFVSSRKERIEAAKEDWRMERFPLVPGDDKERIPLPE